MKKVFCILMAVCMMMVMAACSGNAGAAGDAAQPADSAGDAAQPADSAADADGEAADGGEIVVGILAPLTGAVAEYGNAVANGALMYIEEINAAGGVNGKQIKVEKYDEEGDPVKAVTGYNALVDAGVTAIIGDVTTGPTVAVVAESQADNMPMITASATAASVTCQLDAEGNVTAVYENMFRSCFIDPFQGGKMATFASKELKAAKAAVLYNIGSDYSIGLSESFQKMAAELGMEVVAVESYADGAVDFQSQLTNIAAATPDVLFIPDYYSTIALVATQAASAGVTATMLGADGWDTVLDVVTDASLLEGAYYCSGYSTQDTSEAVQSFVANYEAKYGSTPNMFAAQAYDAAMILLTAVEKAEAAGEAHGSDAYKQAIIDAMNATDMDCVTGHVTYDEYNDPEKTAAIINISGGEAKFWGKY